MGDPSDIRFDCRFCMKPVSVAAKYAGQRVKCPACKNPVVVPGQQDALAASFADAQTSEGGMRRVSTKSIRRGGGFGLGPIIKLALLAAVIYGGYMFFQHKEEQEKKSLPLLWEEYAKDPISTIATHPSLIEDKTKEAVEADKQLKTSKLQTVLKRKKHKEAAVRKLVAKVCGMSRNAKAVDPLFGMLEKDEDRDVRKAAAEALGPLGHALKDKSVVGRLIARLKAEKDGSVKGGIHDSLRSMTGNVDLKGTYDQWNTWWDSTTFKGKKFEYPDQMKIR